jgi:hypothetical protein
MRGERRSGGEVEGNTDLHLHLYLHEELFFFLFVEVTISVSSPGWLTYLTLSDIWWTYSSSRESQDFK